MKRLMLIAIALYFALPAEAQTTSIYVYAKSDNGFVESTRITDTVADLKEVLAKKRKKSTLAATREAADIAMEVVRSESVPGDRTTTHTDRGVFGGLDSRTKTEPLSSITVVLHLRGSDYTKEISLTLFRLWKDLAEGIVMQTEKWIDLNRAQLDAIQAKEAR